MALPAGTTIGSYEIAAPLGAGGMGEVYRARDTRLGREVALKILPDVFAADPERLARFEREAQVLASLNHPNIAIIHGVEETNGVRALVLELVEGDTLADRIARSRIPIEEALPFARQIAEALEAAHEQGIVHRDLKPANIKVRDDGAVKVLDFGLAKLVDSSGGSTDATLSPTITSPALVTGVGMLLGTAAYMSPEQARGRMASKRADVWAFGCVLYEMLTGTRAFQGEDVADTLAAVLRGEPDWSALPKDLSPAVSALIKQCIHRDPRQRVGDMAAVLFTLRTLTGLPGDAQPKTTGLYTRKRLAAMLVLVAVAAAALTSIAWWASSSAPVPRSVARLEITLPAGQTLPAMQTPLLVISPDGETVAYVASQQIQIRPIAGVAKPIPITGFDSLAYTPVSPAFSPTGDSIVFYSPGEKMLKRVAITGGAAVPVCPADTPYGISWGLDGILFGQGSGGILRVSPNPGKPTQVVRVGPNELAAFPQMLPDGDSLLFTLATVGAERFTWDEARIVVQSLKTGLRTTLIEGGSNGRYVGTGHIVYAVGGLLYARTFDLNRTAVGDPVSVVEGVRRGSGSGVLVSSTLPNAAQFDVSAKGTLVYIPGPESGSSLRMHLVLTDRSGKVTPLKVQPGPYQYPRASPVGAQIAYQTDDGREAAIWIYDLSGTASPRRLTFDGNNRFPVWSSDGRSVAYQSDREGDRAIFQQRLDDPAGTAVRLTKPAAGAEHFPESWNGDTLLFSETREAEVKLNVLSVSKKEVAPFRDVTSTRWPNAAFSRDGRWVAYSVKTTSQTRDTLFVEPFPPTGIKHFVSDGDAHFPAWSHDELFYVDAARRSDRGVGFVRRTVRTKPDFALTSEPQQTPREFLVTAGGIGRSRTYDILPDGQRFIGINVDTQAQGGQPAPLIQVVLNWFDELKLRVPAK